MIIRKAYKFRLKTNVNIEESLTIFAGHSRFVWNYFWRLNKHRLDNRQRIMRYHEMNYWLTLLKQSDEYGFLSEAPAHILQQKLMDLDKAYRDAFDKKQPNKRMPRLKKKHLHNSFRYPQGLQFKIENNRLYAPKLGWIGFFKSRNIQGKAKNITISKEGKNWFCSIGSELELNVAKKVPTSANSMGIDVGITKFAALSNGEYIEPISAFKKHEDKLAKVGRILSKKQKFSNNWRKALRRIQELHGKIKNVRLDFLHKATTKISENQALVVVEDLKINNMSKSTKGTITDPGRNVRAKSGLNKAILDQGWGMFRLQLEYKLAWKGGLLVKVPAHHTSQKCNQCGYTESRNRQTQESFCCALCGHKDNADMNAARNILAAGLAVIACGEAALVASVKQESLGIGDLVPA